MKPLPHREIPVWVTPPPTVRQDYTGYQKDDESGLEYSQARYYNTTHGRFTSTDPLTSSAAVKDPQTFNRYSYTLNSPYKFTDPLGLMAQGPASFSEGCSASFSSCSDDDAFDPFAAENDFQNRQPTTQTKPKPKGSKTAKKPKAKPPAKPPIPKQVPTSLKVEKVTLVDPKDVPAGYVNPDSNAQIFVSITYQVLDAKGNPIKDPTLVPLESTGIGANRVSDQGAQQDANGSPEDKNNKTEVGGERSGTSRTTNASGQFVDSLVGIATNTASLGQPMLSRTGQNFGNVSEINFTISQTLYIKQRDKIFEVRANTLSVSFRANSTSITNNQDISACTGTGCSR